MGGGTSKATKAEDAAILIAEEAQAEAIAAAVTTAATNAANALTAAGGKQRCINMLLLGGPNVGKSTIFRQMKLLYMGGFDEDARKQAKLQIIENVLDSVIKVTHLAFRKFNRSFTPDNMEAADRLEEEFDNFASRDAKDVTHAGLDDEIWGLIRNLIKDEAFQETYKYAIDPTRENKHDPLENFSIVDHGVYFLSIIDRVSSVEYLPTDAEILMLRRVTEGRESIEFEMEIELANKKKNQFKLKVTDVGGQAHEQEEWKKVCEEEKLDSVIYVCALSEFDSIDKNNNNILKSQLSLLAKIVKSQLFEDTDLVVLMNKTDLLAKKLVHKKIGDFFKAFHNIDNEPETVVEHFQRELEELSKRVLEKRGVSEVGRLPLVIPTCALDTQMIEKIVPKLCENALMKKMDESGLM